MLSQSNCLGALPCNRHAETDLAIEAGLEVDGQAVEGLRIRHWCHLGDVVVHAGRRRGG